MYIFVLGMSVCVCLLNEQIHSDPQNCQGFYADSWFM